MPNKPMSEVREMVGTSKQTVVDLEIEAGKVEEFARAIKDDDPVFRNEDAAEARGFSSCPAPLTFTRTAYFPRYWSEEIDQPGTQAFDLGLDKSLTVHGEQEYEYERPLQVGDTLTGTSTLTDVYQQEGGRGGTLTFAVVETEYRDQHDDLVVTERLTRIETSKPIDDDAGGAPDE